MEEKGTGRGTYVELDVDVGGFHQKVENVTEQRDRLMRFFKCPNVSAMTNRVESDTG